MLGTFAAAGYDYVFFAVAFVKEAGCKVAVFQGDCLVADRADPLYAFFRYWVAVGAAVYCAQLVGNIHWAVNAAYKVFSGKKQAVAKGAVYDKAF